MLVFQYATSTIWVDHLADEREHNVYEFCSTHWQRFQPPSGWSMDDRRRAEVLPFARAIAQELADGPVWATRWTKLSINQIVKDRVNRLLEASMALEQVTFELADHKEATLAFKEKRKPQWKGR